MCYSFISKMDATVMLQTARSLLKSADLGFQETADLALKGMIITRDVAELNTVVRKMTEISVNSLVALMMIFVVKYVGPKLFYPYLLLEPLTSKGTDDATFTTSHGLMIHTFNRTNYTLAIDVPQAATRLLLEGSTVMFNNFEFKTPHFDSVVKGSLNIDIGKMIVDVKANLSLTNCFVKIAKINVTEILDLSPKIFIDSDPNLSTPLSERFVDYLDKELKDALPLRIHSAVVRRLDSFPLGRALLNCSTV
ncbi:hypothetical protein GE061_002685 [Apolygus lucorum]|uniref:Uncharacterized protein n=1 Tax=Apolygus lucorum TaxID=248454 RepID=A0A6A4J6T8_APOLU|nr:hypothetical protein GE061_002685 [Apolygus lucorum]